ncbi:MAG: hypothetical protein LBG27_01005 [Spirochaetaceae bacterium]|nr:hypothetical protein [Spirochaetaceae bacterium]
MQIIPTKNYTTFSNLHQLCLPMDAGVLIPQDDSVRLLAFVLKRLDLTPCTKRIPHTAKGGEGRRPTGNVKRRNGTPGNWSRRMKRKAGIPSRVGGWRKRKTGSRHAI